MLKEGSQNTPRGLSFPSRWVFGMPLKGFPAEQAKVCRKGSPQPGVLPSASQPVNDSATVVAGWCSCHLFLFARYSNPLLVPLKLGCVSWVGVDVLMPCTSSQLESRGRGSASVCFPSS
jgi:hypothetical protein